MMMRNRIAAVSYLNTIPFIYGIEHAGAGLHAELLLSPPRGCAEALRDGKADLALIPVAAIPGISDLRIVTPYCIGASGPVRTVVLASADPLENVDTVYLDSHSFTSVRLVRLLAAKLWKREFRWRELDDFSVLDDPKPRTGYVIIGDKVFAREAAFRYRYDLAEQWRLLTGLPFVFAAWVARGGVPEATVDSLTEALAYGTAHIDEAIRRYGYGDRPYARDYLTRNIDFVFDEQKRRAMELYWEEGLRIEPPINPG